MRTKFCKGCRIEKPIDNFTKSKNIKDGYENKCKVCRSMARKKHVKICQCCKEEFKTSDKDAKFCSSKCHGASRRRSVLRNCAYCDSEVEVSPSKSRNQEVFYCDQDCRTEHLKVIMKEERNPNYNRVDYKCDGCNKSIKVIPSRIKQQKYIFCSNECYKNNIGLYFSREDNPNYNHQTFKCKECESEFKRIPSQAGENHFCSTACFHKNRIGKGNGKVETACSVCGQRMRVWKSRLDYIHHLHCSKECAAIGQSERYSGENSHAWNKELTIEERLINRKYPEYYQWRDEVFKRDSFTCQACSDNRGGNLVAHHILNYSEHKELRVDIDNGITLCNACHKNFHDTYGYTKNTLEELEDFLNKYTL